MLIDIARINLFDQDTGNFIGIYLFNQNMGMAFVKARCTHIPFVLIFLGEMQLSVVKSRSALSPLASCYSII